jgi:arginine N-succinyltransferase
MYVLRPVTESDLEGIYQLALKTGGGLTTLPPDRERLSEKIRESVKNFQFLPTKPSGEIYFFVLEDTAKKKIVGTSAVYSKVGGFQPFWTYEIKTAQKVSKVLNVNKEVQYLQVKMEHNGPSEIGTLFLDPEYRHGNCGRLLSLSRFLFVAEFRKLFEDSFVAELRGRIDKDGQSVFWDCLGAHFFDVPFEKADLMVNEDKSFIDDLMPKHPIYISLLPREAQVVIGMVHDDTRPAMRLLEQEGFSQIDEVDIFEAGPILEAPTDQIRCVKNSIRVSCQKGEPDQPQESGWGQIEKVNDQQNMRYHLVANVKSALDFRVVASEISVGKDESISLPDEAMDCLGLDCGSAVRYVALRPGVKL